MKLLAILAFTILVVFDMTLVWGTGLTFWMVLIILGGAAFCIDWAKE